MDEKCPFCGSDVKEYPMGWGCSGNKNYFCNLMDIRGSRLWWNTRATKTLGGNAHNGAQPQKLCQFGAGDVPCEKCVAPACGARPDDF